MHRFPGCEDLLLIYRSSFADPIIFILSFLCFRAMINGYSFLYTLNRCSLISALHHAAVFLFSHSFLLLIKINTEEHEKATA